MNRDYSLRDRATQPQKATHANQASERLSQGAIDATDATQDKPQLFTRVPTIPEAVQHSLADGFTEDSLFTFARALKAFEMTHDRRLSPEELSSAFVQWWIAAKPKLPGDASFDEYRLLSLEVFNRIRFPLGANALEAAIQRADTEPLPPCVASYQDARLGRLLAVCYYLQQFNGESPFILSVRDDGRIMGITDKKRAAKLLNGLSLDGWLVMVEKGVQGVKRATRYRFVQNPQAPGQP